MKKAHIAASAVGFLVTCLAGCAPLLPGTFRNSPPGPGAPEGPITSLARSGSYLLASSPGGIFTRGSAGPWTPLTLPEGLAPAEVTAMTATPEEVLVGTSRSGLFTWKDGTWTHLTAAGGELPDDQVLCLAVEGEGQGLGGGAVWAGTAKGLALRRDGRWEPFSPEGKWLTELTAAGKSAGEFFLTRGFRFGGEGEERSLFRPPVTAVGTGPGVVILGTDRGRISILQPGRFATFHLDGDPGINHLLVDGPAVWCGTSSGLVWGGLREVARGRPHPSWRGAIPSLPVVFAVNNTRPFDYQWYAVGYNTAAVAGLAGGGKGGLWVAFRAGGSTAVRADVTAVSHAATGLRRYPAAEDYIAREEEMYYEEYGSSQGIVGAPLCLLGQEDGGVWLGTEKGLFALR